METNLSLTDNFNFYVHFHVSETFPLTHSKNDLSSRNKLGRQNVRNALK